jgi:hypothetical protein
MAQAVTRRLPTAAVQIRSQFRSRGIYDRQSGTWTDFSECFGSPWQFSFHRMIHTHLSRGAGTIGPLLAGIKSGLSLITPHE